MGFNLSQGLSSAGYGVGELYAKKSLMDTEAANREVAAQADSQRAMRLEEFKQALGTRVAEEQRTAQVSRIDAKASELADSSLAPKRGLIDSGIVDRSSWTPEQQAAVDQSLALDKDKAVRDPKTSTEAAIATGDITPKDAATLTQKDDAALYKILWEKEKEDRRDTRFTEQQDRMDARQAAQQAAAFALLDKRLEASQKKDGEGKGNTLQSTQVDGNGYLVGVFRDGTTKRMTDPETGKPITSQSFEQRVDRVANTLVKEGESKYRKMDPEQLRAHVRQTLMSADGAAPKPAAPPPAAGTPKLGSKDAPAPKADAKPAAGARKVGESQTVQSGPHKGKTAVWDGQGWKLQ
jgi:hypothetical protein